METIVSSIKCTNCRSKLLAPILLPCGHVICKKHTEEEGVEQIECIECCLSHPNKEFVVIRPLSAIIQAGIDSIDFGAIHTEARKSCDRLEKELEKIDAMLKNVPFFISKIIDDLKNQVQLRSEEFKFRIDEAAEKLTSELKCYEDECNRNLESGTLKTSLNEFKTRKEEAGEHLIEWRKSLNELIYDENKCKLIKSGINRVVNELAVSEDLLKQQVFIGQLMDKKRSVEMFRRITIGSLLVKKEKE